MPTIDGAHLDIAYLHPLRYSRESGMNVCSSTLRPTAAGARAGQRWAMRGHEKAPFLALGGQDRNLRPPGYEDVCCQIR